jgi:hypothetical protein
VLKSNLAAVDQLGKEAEKAKAAPAVHTGEGGKPGHDGNAAGPGAEHSGGHSGKGH